jgi:hypothetical protein
MIRALTVWCARAAAIVAVLAAAGILLHLAVNRWGGLDRAAAEIEAQSKTGLLEDRKTPVFWPNTIECVSYSILWARGPHPDLSATLLSPSVVYDHGALPCTMLRSAIEGGNKAVWRDYTRYWHGNLTVIGPALALGGLRGLEIALHVLLWVSAALAALGLARFGGLAMGTAFGGFVFAYFDAGWTSLAPTQAIAYASALLAIALFAGLAKGRDLGGAALAAFTAGAALNYFDFLYAAPLLAGACAAIMLTENRPDTERWKKALAVFLAALAGYAGMFVAKWALALVWFAAVEGRLVLPIEPGHVTRWTGSAAESEQIPVWRAIFDLLYGTYAVEVKPAWLAATLPVLTAAAAAFAWLRAGARRALEIAGAFAGVMVLMALMADHTWVHKHIVFRTPLLMTGFLAAAWIAAGLQGRASGTSRMRETT